MALTHSCASTLAEFQPKILKTTKAEEAFTKQITASLLKGGLVL